MKDLKVPNGDLVGEGLEGKYIQDKGAI